MSRDRISRARLGAGAIALATLLAGATTSVANAVPSSGGGPVVVTSDGAVQGTTPAGANEFLGVPYAAPPVGQLRWAPPQPAAHWSGVRAATAFGPHCAQPVSAFGKASTSEDCLFLNVFTPAGHRESNRPVMLWIHGGALTTGESNDYPGAALVPDGPIVVTINYRLGALGFLAHPALTARPGGPSGDYGLMDQQAALRWVQRDISAFGGNPHDVTIFGESAGGLSVLSQLASPGAHGLFAKAIVESGAYNPVQASLTSAEAAGGAFAAKAGCADQTAACLRGLPVSTILANENSGYTPNIDGQLLTQSLKPAFASGQFNRVPVIDGSNHDEWRLFVAGQELLGNHVTAANYQAQISATLSVPAATAAVIAAQYPLSAFPSPPVALGAVGTDAIFACNALTADQSLSRFVPTFAYEFNDENAPEPFLPPVSFPYGAAHASELPYVFNSATTPVAGGLSASQIRLAETMQRYWTGFAARGFPSWFGTPFWPGFNAGTGMIQSLVPPRPGVETNFATDHHCAFWNAAG
ncbi:MAG TPA: carboxylesterase family protein [Pseudonocardiaceae bacterium]